MRFLITCDGQKPFVTAWFDAENNFRADLNMFVYDLLNWTYTKDGITWNVIKFDHL